jgi:hypothetical protein
VTLGTYFAGAFLFRVRFFSTSLRIINSLVLVIFFNVFLCIVYSWQTTRVLSSRAQHLEHFCCDIFRATHRDDLSSHPAPTAAMLGDLPILGLDGGFHLYQGLRHEDTHLTLCQHILHQLYLANLNWQSLLKLPSCFLLSRVASAGRSELPCPGRAGLGQKDLAIS